MGFCNQTPFVKLFGVCLLMFVLSFSWLGFIMSIEYIMSLILGEFCIIGQPCMLFYKFELPLAFLFQIIINIVAGIFVYKILAQNNLLQDDKLAIRTLKIWSLTIVIFLFALFVASQLDTLAESKCYESCGISPHCSRQCNQYDLRFNFVLWAAIAGVHNPITLFLSGFIAKKSRIIPL